MQLPDRPPFTIRGRVLSPLDEGGLLDLPDGLVDVAADGRIAAVVEAASHPQLARAAVDARGLVLLPGLIDLHVHLPQVPAAGLGFGLGLLPWLERQIYPLERAWADPDVAAARARDTFEAMAAAGTTTILAYGAVFAAGLAAAFEAARRHGIRAILGKVMMDRGSYDSGDPPRRILDRSIRESLDLAEAWHGAAGGRLGYAFTPRFAVSCSPEMLRTSAEAARATGAWWQSHVAEDRGEIAEVARLFPEARDYVDVYDRAGALGPRSLLAHGIYLSDRELERLAESGTRLIHCPASNLFLGTGVMPLARARRAGVPVGLGSDVAGGPELSVFSVMRAGAWSQVARRTLLSEPDPLLAPVDWLRLATLDGAAALGLDDTIGSLQPGKAADMIAVDPEPPPPLPSAEEPDALISRLIFRARRGMVRAAWVDGRRLPARAPDGDPRGSRPRPARDAGLID